MQNRNFFQKLLGFVRRRGYYLVLGVCALAVAVSGYLYMRKETQPRTLSTSAIPQQVTQPDETEKTPPAQRNALKPEREPKQETKQEPEKPFSLAMPLDGELLQPYSLSQLSYNETTRDWRTHEGIDLAAQLGTPVKAAADGTVASIYEDDALGTVVTVSHSGGYLSRYANLSPETKVSVGQTVKQGTVLGVVGTTALMETGSSPHLHFELCHDAVSCDPAEFFTW